MSDSIVVMNGGRIEQKDKPKMCTAMMKWLVGRKK